MILESVRLRDVRGFGGAGVQLDLHPGLNVLSEANEFGKSTVFDAVRAALFFKHTANTEATRSLVPWIGGVPQIEIDMDLGGAFDGPVRLLRKFHRTSGVTELFDIRTGRSLAVADEAHQVLQDHLGDKPGSGPTGLLWVEQGHSIAQPDTGPANTALLKDLLAGEVGTLTGGRRAEAILAEAKRKLGELVTAKTQKPTGLYREVIAHVDTLESELAVLVKRAESTETARAELSRVVAELEALDTDSTDVGFSKIAAAREALRMAEHAEAQQARLRSERDLLARDAETAEARNAQFVATVNEIAHLRERLDMRAKARTGLEERMKILHKRRDALRAEESKARDHARGARARLGDAQKAVASEAARRELDGLRDRFATALRADAELAELGEPKAAPTKSEMTNLHRLRQALAVAEGRFKASATRLRAAASGFSLDGAPLRVGEEIAVEGESEISWEGRILHLAAPNARQAGVALRAARAGLAAALAEVNAESVEAAQAAFDAADERHRTERRLRDRRVAHAPEGLERLASEVARLEGLVGESAEPASDPQSLADDLEIAETRVFEVQGELRSLEYELSRVTSEMARETERSAAAEAQLAALQSQVSGDVETVQAEHRSRVKATAAALEAARAALVNQEQASPSLQAAKADVERLEAGARNRSARRQALSERRGALRETLRTAGADAIGELLAEVDGRLSRAVARRDALRRRADALALLVETLESTGTSLREQFLAPVKARLHPLLREVIPDVQINFGSDYRASGLSRGGREEDVLSLSGGTQGQIAVLTRLAFADVMQARGRPMPVVLDETFVHSDHLRLEGLFRALNMACAGGVQCIVMTCHERMYRDLGGHRVIPREWQ